MILVEFINTILLVLLPLMVLTLIVGENPIYSLSERLLVGVTIGYALTLSIYTIIEKCWTPMIEGRFIYIIPFVLGFLLYSQLSEKFSWLTRFPIAVMAGTNIGLIIRGKVVTDFVKQILSTTTLSLTTPDMFRNISNLILFIGTITSVSYFLFSSSYDTGPMTKVRKIGRYFLLIALGSSFGMTASYRQNALISRFSVILAPSYKWLTVGTVIVLSLLLFVLSKSGYIKKQ